MCEVPVSSNRNDIYVLTMKMAGVGGKLGTVNLMPCAAHAFAASIDIGVQK